MSSDEDKRRQFRSKIATINQKEKEAKELEQKEGRVWDEDLIPDVETTLFNTDVDAIIAAVDFPQAYRLWAKPGSKPIKFPIKPDGNMFTCPFSGHLDRTPSASFSSDNLWNCHPCNLGGDITTLAALHYGYTLSNYQDPENFPVVRRRMAEDLGYRFQDIPGRDKPKIVPPRVEPELTAEEAAEEEAIQDEEDDEYSNINGINTLDWRSIVRPGSFQDEYMKVASLDDSPEEYHFFNSLMLLGLIAGRNVVLQDSDPVLGNLFLVLFGPSSARKSRSFRYIFDLIDKIAPYDDDDSFTTGVRMIKGPSSGETVIDQMDRDILDPEDVTISYGKAPVKAVVRFSELSELMSKISRPGNSIKEVLMDLYDTGEAGTSSRGGGIKSVRNGFCSLASTSQPAYLKDVLNRTHIHSGFANRLLFITSTPKPRRALGGTRVTLDVLTEPLTQVKLWADRGPKTVNWTPESTLAFEKFFRDKIVPAQDEDESNILGRLDLLCKKLVLLFCINSMCDEVPVWAVECVEGMFKYILRTYGITASRIKDDNPSRDVEEDVLRQIKNWHDRGGITANVIRKNLKHKNYSLDQIMKALTVMGKLELIQGAAVNKGMRGRPTTKYLLLKDK